MPVFWLIAGFLALVAFAAVCRWILDNPREDAETGLFFRPVRLYCRIFHRLRVEGAEHVPEGRAPGPLIVVANHTAGVDPLLVQSVCPFEIRWIMAEDMRLPALDRFWRWARIIFVDRRGASSAAMREAMRHLATGGVVGIFPEGGIERPPRTILPFMRGVGLMIAKSRAPVLPVLIDGTPQIDPAWASLWKPSRSRLRFLPIVDYRDDPPDFIVDDLRGRFLSASGWASNDSGAPEQHGAEPHAQSA